MTGIEDALIIGAITGGSAAATGMVAWVGKRIHTKLDRIGDILNGDHGHTARLAVIESKLPNGEWREIGSTLSRVENTVLEVQQEQKRVRREFSEHIDREEERIVSAVSKIIQPE